jgi:hypothetical protein
LGGVSVRDADWAAISGDGSLRDAFYLHSSHQWNMLFQGQMLEAVTGTFVSGDSLYDPAKAHSLSPHRAVEAQGWGDWAMGYVNSGLDWWHDTSWSAMADQAWGVYKEGIKWCINPAGHAANLSLQWIGGKLGG